MNQPWLLKAAAFQVLRVLPESAYHVLTTKVTRRSGKKRLQDSDTGNASDYYRNAEKHANTLSQHIDPENDLVLEFGAGKDLLSNLLLSYLGFRNQLTIDLNCRVRPIYLNSILKQLPAGALGLKAFTQDFQAELGTLGITYSAPFDMRRTCLGAESVAAITSTNTLEHIPLPDIQMILSECYRLLRPNGICSFKIDYSDHYSHTDRQISKYNFLKFSDSVWRLLSPPNHFQNRMRHCDYATLFKNAGFQILAHDAIFEPALNSQLMGIKLAKKYRGYSREDLAPVSGWFVLRKHADEHSMAAAVT